MPGVMCNIIVKADLGRSIYTATPNMADDPTLANGPPSDMRIDALNTATPNL